MKHIGNIWVVFILVGLSAGFLNAQTDPKFESYLEAERAKLPVEADLLYDASKLNGYRFGGTKTVVDADSSLPFGKAMRLTVSTVGANPWEPQFQTPNNAIPLTADDYILYVFYIRVIESATENGKGQTIFYSQRASSPWTGLGSQSITINPIWRQYYVLVQAPEDFDVQSMQATFHLGSVKQIVEIGGMLAFHLGSNVDVEDLPTTPIYYEGMEPDASWRAEAAARIEQHRKGDLHVVVKNQNGEPIKRAEVSVEMQKHAFGFGTFMSELALESTNDAENYKDEVVKLFNYATTPFYMGDGNWGWYGPGDQQTTYPALAEWLKFKNIPTKGHVLVWPSWTWMPPMFQDLADEPEALRDAIAEHIDTIVPLGDERGVSEWDVVNEPHINHDVMDICGEDIMIEWYKQVHALHPEARLIMNEYNIIMNGGSAAFQSDFEYYIQLLLDGGAPLHGIGMQCHFDANLTDIPYALDMLDRFSKFGLPIQITEFDIDIRNEEIQAAYTRDFFTAIFSHPSVEKIIMWGFWEGDQWKPNGAMIRTDWSYKPNYHVYTDLVFDEWWTEKEGRSNGNGQFSTRGFLGEYSISATFDGNTVSKDIELLKDGTTVELTIPTTQTGIEDREQKPVQFGLRQNYPNPFNASTVIEFVPQQSGAADLVLYDTRGSQIYSKRMNVIKEEHYRTELNLSHLPTGSYFYALLFEDGAQTSKKMLLVK